MTAINGTNLAAPIVPFTTEDFFPTHKAQYGQGGWHEVATIADRDAITEARREAGMAVYVTSEQKLFILNNDLTTWTEFSSGGVKVMPDPLSKELGTIVHYVGPTNTLFHQGYFYQTQIVGEESELTSRVDSATLENVEANKGTFEEFVQPTEDMNLEFVYVGTSGEDGHWTLDGESVDIFIYGVTYEGEPENEDKIILSYKAADSSVEWVAIDVQASGSEEQIRALIAEHNADPNAHPEIVSSLNDYIAHVEEEKQDKLKEGENITIEEDGTINAIVDPGTRDYNELENKPAIDGVTLTSSTTKADLGLGNIFVFKGTVADLEELEEIENPSQGDTYYVTSEGGQYSWSGTEWSPIGSSVSVNIDDTLKGTGSEASPIGLSDKTQAALLVPDTTTMTPISTVEFDMNSTGYYRFLTIPNHYEALSDLNGTAIFRITITGTGINSVIEGVLYLRQRVAEAPYVVMRHKSGTKSAAYTGTRYMRLVYPKNLNKSEWGFDLRPYNAKDRHVKVEVFKTEDGFVWEQGIAGTYSSSVQSNVSLSLYTNDGIIGSSNLYWNANTATSAGYVSSYLPKFVSGGTMPVCGEQVPTHALTYISDGKFYPSSNLIKEINPEFGIQLCEVTTKVNAAMAYTSLRQKEVVTSLTQIPHGTLTKGDPCYFRCRLIDGKIYSDNYVSTTMTPGYTWYYIGVASSATAIMIDTSQSFFVTMSADGDLQRLNGKRFDAYTKKETDDLIELIQAGSDVRDIVKNYEELLEYPVDQLKDRDVIEILEDEEHEGTATYYRWIIDEEHPEGHWVYLGERGPYYTKRQTRDLIRDAIAAEALLRQDADNLLSDRIDGLAKYGKHYQYPFNIPTPEDTEEGTLLFIENPGLDYLGEIPSSELPVTSRDGVCYLVDSEKYAVWMNGHWNYYALKPSTLFLSNKYDLYINHREVNYYGYDITSETYHPYGTSVFFTRNHDEYTPIYLIYPSTDTTQQSCAFVYGWDGDKIIQVASSIAPYAYKNENDEVCYWTEKIEDHETGYVELPSMRDSTHEEIYFYNDEEELYETYQIVSVDRENNTVTDSADNVYTRFAEADKLYSCFEHDGEKIWVLGDANSESFSPIEQPVYVLNEDDILEVYGMNVAEYDVETKTVTIESEESGVEGESYTYTNNPKVLDIFDCIGKPNRHADLVDMSWAPLSNYGGSGKSTAENTEYHNDAIPTMENVQQALDKLMNFHYYTNPTGTFNVSNLPSGIQEIGSTVSAPFVMTWNLTNRTPASNDTGYYKLPDNVQHNTLEKTGSDIYETDITSTTNNAKFTFQYYYKDNNAEVPSGKTNVWNPSKTITFGIRRFWGVTSTETLPDVDLTTILSSEVETGRTQARKFNCTGGKYWWFVIPTAWTSGIKFVQLKDDLKTVVADITLNPDYIYTRTITNQYGIETAYTLYRVEYMQRDASVCVGVQ